ncbi:MAG TPA: hypothetical protein VJ506_02690 [Candidatus Limnocylindrales bacterium]|nr:hypothetical protein [Candidatus Limnocylindrales bacterium]
MSFVAPKLVLTPLLIASASLAGRRWGAITSGWLLALPLTSGPIAIFVSLDLGPAAGVQVAAGSLLGATGQVAFCLAYAAASSRLGWPACLAIGSATFAVVAGVLEIALPAWAPLALFALAVAVTLAALALPVLQPGAPDAALAVARPGRWDIPARAVVATILVLAISAVAPIVGGHVAGILATFPVYISVLTTFAHRVGGPSQARGVLRGLVLGLPGFATFFLTVAAFVESLGVLPAFGLALTIAVVLNASILGFIVRSPAGPSAP